ncbi:MAG: carboxypeptidase regulatory-like domain-containing protein, partial [Leptospiraceae bacterium]|nr:carboxypeptidase regulatory-like domain-containing protein [Leptospiraceae bacterium]
ILLLLILTLGFHCKPTVPESGNSLVSLMNNFRKLLGVSTTEEQATLTVSGTLLDTSGNTVGGAQLTISDETSGTKAVVDKTAFTDSNGRFAINLKVGFFHIEVKSGLGNYLGYVRIRITGVTSPPTIVSLTGVTLDGLTASPVGIPATFSPTAYIVLTDTGFDSIYEGTTRLIGISLAGTTNQNITISIISDSTAVGVGGTLTGGTTTNGVTIGGTVTGSGQTAQLTFTKDNYKTTQYLPVTALNDDLNNINESATLTISSPVTTDKVLTFKCTDKETLNFDPTTTISPVILEGTSSQVNVRLNFAPAANVVVEISTSNQSALRLTNLANSQVAASFQVTFTPANYFTPQSFSLTALEDANTTLEEYNVTIRAIDTTLGIQDRAQVVVLADNDMPITYTSLSTNRTHQFLHEGETATFTVRLNSDPGMDRVVNLSSSNPLLSLDLSSLTFTRSNWGEPQTVTVTAVQDADAIDVTSITITGSGTGLITSALPALIIYDDEQGSFIIDYSELGGDRSFLY